MTQNIGLSVALSIILSNACIPADGFLHLINIRAPKRNVIHQQLSANKKEGTKSKYQHRWKHEPFDFSSKIGWDKFYRDGLKNTNSKEETPSSGDDGDTMESLEFEWHPHIPHSAIVDAIKPAVSQASNHYSDIQSTSSSQKHIPSILLVGTGNSCLPRVLHDAFETPVQVTCLDYSPVCIEMIRSMYESSCPNMDFVVGDAINLKEVVWDEQDTEKPSTEEKRFDVIVDKGLLDALMCGEGFDLERLMESTNDVLTPYEWGMHVLICFKLSKASKQSLNELGCTNENEPGLVWNFDIPVDGSEKGRASFNLAVRCRERVNGLDIEHITTQWV